MKVTLLQKAEEGLAQVEVHSDGVDKVPLKVQGSDKKSSQTKTVKQADFELPSFLAELPSTDPAYSRLNSSGHKWAIGKPGKGGVKEFKVVTFVSDSPVFRVYGGNAQKCGYWWTVETP